MFKHSVVVSLQPVKGSECRPVRLRVAWAGQRCDLPVGVSYNVGKWIKEMGRARPNTRNDYKQTATEVNGTIEDAVRWVDAFFVKSAVGGGVPSAKELRFAFASEFRGKSTEAQKSCGDILSAFDRFFLENAQVKGWSENTQKKYSSLKSILREYDVTCANFGEVFLRDYLKTEISKGHKNSSISKNLRLFKIFGRWLRAHGIVADDGSSFVPHLKWSGGNTKAVVYLEFNEIQKLINARGLSSKHDLIRDMFVFSCFSGLRFSDVVKLRKMDVKNGKIYVLTQKTADCLEIELNNYTREIFGKYKDVPGEFLFPCTAQNSKINYDLKKLFRLLGLSRGVRTVHFSGSERVEKISPLYDVISFHAARRSFVVECLRRGIPPTVIMKWTGHSNFDAMKPYVEIVDSLKTSEMSKFDA